MLLAREIVGIIIRSHSPYNNDNIFALALILKLDIIAKIYDQDSSKGSLHNTGILVP
jgi:hypothetical protein